MGGNPTKQFRPGNTREARRAKSSEKLNYMEINLSVPLSGAAMSMRSKLTHAGAKESYIGNGTGQE